MKTRYRDSTRSRYQIFERVGFLKKIQILGSYGKKSWILEEFIY